MNARVEMPRIIKTALHVMMVSSFFIPSCSFMISTRFC